MLLMPQPAFAIGVPGVAFEYLFIRSRNYKFKKRTKFLIINWLCVLKKNEMNNYAICAPGMQKKC